MAEHRCTRRTFHPFSRLPLELQLRCIELLMVKMPDQEVANSRCGSAIPQYPRNLTIAFPEHTKLMLPAFYKQATIELVYLEGSSTRCYPALVERAAEGREFLRTTSKEELHLVRNLKIVLSDRMGNKVVDFELHLNPRSRSIDCNIHIHRRLCISYQEVQAEEIQNGSPRDVAMDDASSFIDSIYDRPGEKKGLHKSDITTIVAHLWNINASSSIFGDTTRGIGDRPYFGSLDHHVPLEQDVIEQHEQMFGVAYEKPSDGEVERSVADLISTSQKNV